MEELVFFQCPPDATLNISAREFSLVSARRVTKLFLASFAFLTSPAFNNHRIDTRYGNLGPEENIKFGIPQTSFPLTWKGAPEGTVSYAIVFIDYDDVPDEGVPFIHWLACNIPGNQNSLPENSSRLTPDYLQGYNSWCMPFPRI